MRVSPAADVSAVGARMPDTQREALRLKALAEIALLDTPPEREFDALVRIAQRMLGTSMSAVSLVDTDRNGSRRGPGRSRLPPRATMLCALSSSRARHR